MAYSISDVRRYQHGGNPKIDMYRLRVSSRSVLDFSVNVNSLGPPEIIKEKWDSFFSNIGKYPELDGEDILYYYTDKFDISPGNLLAGNGSTEIIYLLPRALRIRNVAIICPSYHDYERAARIAGATVRPIRMLPENDFAFPEIDQIKKELEWSDALWFGRPNNPTGTAIQKESIIELARFFPDKIFIIDEAFVQFMKNWEKECLLTEKYRNNIVIIHSLTKFYALPGLRLGVAVGPEDLIRRMRYFKEPWTVNSVAGQVARLLIDCDEYERMTRQRVTEEYRKIYEHLEGIEGIKPFPSCANFVLCRWDREEDLDFLLQYLLSEGVHVRDCRNFHGLEGNYFRIGFRAPEENDRLLEILSSFTLKAN